MVFVDVQVAGEVFPVPPQAGDGGAVGGGVARSWRGGKAEGLRVSLAAAEEKITQLVAQHKHRKSLVFLGILAIDRIAGRTG